MKKEINKAKTIGSKHLEVNWKNKLEETGKTGKKLEERGRNGKKKKNWKKKHGNLKESK